jgi:hypothetical protein
LSHNHHHHQHISHHQTLERRKCPTSCSWLEIIHLLPSILALWHGKRHVLLHVSFLYSSWATLTCPIEQVIFIL